MKGKFKKFLAGLTMGVVGAVALTGCSLTAGDLSINQGELDKLLSGVNQYIETLPARDELENILIQNAMEYYETDGYQIELSMIHRDKNGITVGGYNDVMKVYVDDETKIHKELSQFTSGDEISNSYNNLIYDSEQEEYTYKSYNLLEKTYTQEISTIGYPYGNTTINSLIRVILNRVQDTDTEAIRSNVYKTLLDNDEVQYVFSYNRIYEGTLNEDGFESRENAEYFKIIFKESKLIYFEIENYTNLDGRETFSKQIAKFTYNTGDFTVDTSDFTLVED